MILLQQEFKMEINANLRKPLQNLFSQDGCCLPFLPFKKLFAPYERRFEERHETEYFPRLQKNINYAIEI